MIQKPNENPLVIKMHWLVILTSDHNKGYQILSRTYLWDCCHLSDLYLYMFLNTIKLHGMNAIAFIAKQCNRGCKPVKGGFVTNHNMWLAESSCMCIVTSWFGYQQSNMVFCQSFQGDLPCSRKIIKHQNAIEMWWKVCQFEEGGINIQRKILFDFEKILTFSENLSVWYFASSVDADGLIHQ